MHSPVPDVPPIIAPIPDGNVRPLWSVMIPTHNCIKFIRHTLESVLKQDLGEDIMQIEVVDDFSSDGDVERLVKEVGKGRIDYFRHSRNVGSLRNFETCLNRSQGHWIHLLHGDDCTKDGFYNEISTLFNNYPDTGAAFTNFTCINTANDDLNIHSDLTVDVPGILENFVSQICRRQYIQPPTIVVKRTVYEKLGGFYSVHYGEDWEMWGRIAGSYPIAYSPKILAEYRIANFSSISHKSFESGQNIIDIRKVIEHLQLNLPKSERPEARDYALEHYAISCIRVGTWLLSSNRKAAIIQVKGGLSLAKTAYTRKLAIRFYIMYFTRFKNFKNLLKKLLNR